MVEYTQEDIEQVYKSALQSVELITKGKPDYMSPKRWEEQLDRNKKHIEQVLKYNFWTNEDLTPLQQVLE